MSGTAETSSRVVGAIVGLAVGDALGAPVEAMDREEIAARHPDGLRSFAESPTVRRGEVTDDTEMAFLVARSLIERRNLVMTDIADRLISWKDSGGIAGPSTSRGVEALRNGKSWARSGSSADASSGCLPRCVPVALALAPELVAEGTADCCRPTHRHELAIASSVALNGIIARLVRGNTWDAALAAAGSELDRFAGGRVVAAVLDDPVGAPAAHRDDAVGVLAQAFAALRSSDSAAEAVVTSVAAGGDTDTAGSVAGALAGARWGVTAFDEDWIQGCESGAKALALGAALAELCGGIADRIGEQVDPLGRSQR